jgi:threonylcarbamoyladenosine tRNA methylthiotransferase MtaB
MAERPRVLLQTLGCRLNEAELQEWAEGFRRRGFEIVSDQAPQGIDLVVVNTCAVTAEAARKSRKILRRARRSNPSARLVASGCLSALEGDSGAGQLGLDLVVTNRDKDRLVEIAATALDLPALPALASADSDHPLFARGRQRAFVKVQDGCRHACTFCITTRARGDERSRPIGSVVEAVRRLADEGIQEVVLAGVHLGGYGRDLGTDLAALIRALLEQTDLPRLRLGSLEPWDLPRGFWDLFADGRLMPHLHLPMQSGADSVLRRMARRCRTATFTRLAERGRARVPRLNLTTDIIVGFPGETEEEWEQTLAFVDSMGFGQIHAFGYSPRDGTRAAALPGRVDLETQRRRAAALRALESRLRRRALRAQIGTRAAVLMEARGPSGHPGGAFGYTPNYLPVAIAGDNPGARPGCIVEVSITGVDAGGDTLLGEMRGTLGPG